MVVMATAGRPISPTSTPEDQASGDTSPRTGRSARAVGGLKSALRRQKVNFSLGGSDSPPDDASPDPSTLEAGLSSRSIPEIRTPDSVSQDIGDAPAEGFGYNLRTHAAAEKARHIANRLYSNLSRSNSMEDLSNTSTYESGNDRAPFLSAGTNETGLSQLLPWSARKARKPREPPAGSHSPPLRPLRGDAIHLNDILLSSYEKPSRPYDINEDTDESEGEEMNPLERQANAEYLEEAKRLVRSLTRGSKTRYRDPGSGTRTPAVDKHLHDLEYVPPPQQYKPSVLGALLTSRLNALQRDDRQSKDFYKGFDHLDGGQSPAGARTPEMRTERAQSYDSSAGSSGRATPSRKAKWYDKNDPGSATAAMLAQAGMSSAAPGLPGSSTPDTTRRPSLPRNRSTGMISSAVDIIKSGASSLKPKPRQPDYHTVTINAVADILARRRYLTKLCKAFMEYGAPTHRLEEYMQTSARALCMNAQFLYMPGAMLCTYIDENTFSTDVEMIRTTQGLDFGRLKNVSSVYKCVIHEKYEAAEASELLDEIANRGPRYPTWFRIFVFGIAAVCVSPFAFSGRPIDFGPIFILGATTGFLQLMVVPRSSQFSNVFEVFAAVVTAFVARGLGSIEHNGATVFCFSSIAQSSIALILPGYIVLNAALELQSRNLVSGSVRLVFSIVYVLFLAFGLLLGTVIYGLIDRNATRDTTCNIPDYWDASNSSAAIIYTKFIWVPMFACCLAIINQAKWKQLPIMALIATSGYQASYWVSTRVASNSQVANAIGAFVIGSMANLYSRIWHGLAAAAMLPAIFVLVPSGLAASGSLIAGVASSEQILNNSTATTNSTQSLVQSQNEQSSSVGSIGIGMVQVAIGISVGLYLSALVVYPLGKAGRSRSGLFSF